MCSCLKTSESVKSSAHLRGTICSSEPHWLTDCGAYSNIFSFLRPLGHLCLAMCHKAKWAKWGENGAVARQSNFTSTCYRLQ